MNENGYLILKSHHEEVKKSMYLLGFFQPSQTCFFCSGVNGQDIKTFFAIDSQKNCLGGQEVIFHSI